MSVINATPLLAAAGGDYQISRSVRLRSSASGYFNRTPASSGNRRTWTWSGWVKRGAINSSGYYSLFSAGTTSPTYDGFRFGLDSLQFFQAGGNTSNLVTTSVYRDASAWYHVVLAVDTTQATSSNRVKIYVNGVQTTSFSTANYPSLNAEASINNTLVHNVGAQQETSASFHFDGYLTEVNFIDGQALTPSSFGETDSITGVWKPKKYAGTYGTNGFYLPFKDNTISVLSDTATVTAPFGGTATNARVTDGVYVTSNTSTGSSFTFVQYDFGSAVWLTRFYITNLYFTGGISTFQVQYGNDPTWTTFTVAGSLSVTGSAQTFSGSIMGSARYVRLLPTAFGTNGQANVDAFVIYQDGLGNDYSGNSNNWTPNNISVTAGATYDSMLDVPTLYADGGNGRGNYATLNPIVESSGSPAGYVDGNLKANGTASTQKYGYVTIRPNGKFYAEFAPFNVPSDTANFVGISSPFARYYASNGQVYNGSSWVSYGATYSAVDTIGMAIDTTAGTLEFFKNNTSQGQLTGLTTGEASILLSMGIAGGVAGWNANFGQRPFAYTPPTGFKALNTQNLPEPTIKKGNQYFDATTYTGNAGTNTITNSGAMQPDLVWMKSRSAADWHYLIDAVRGGSKILYSNTTSSEATDSTAVQSFNANGFTIGNNAPINTSGASYIGWQWKESPSAGFDIVTYTGTGVARTVAHSLGVKPSMMIVKNRSSGTTGWAAYHSALGATKVLELNTTSAAVTASGEWNNTEPTSSVFTVGTSSWTNNNTNSIVAYLFSEVAGFSKFGSYTGNGSADGPFVFCGFRPKFILMKRTDSTSWWTIFDATRNPANASNLQLNANVSDAEYSSVNIDILSNGFKLRQVFDAGNAASGSSHIFACFAESPFKNSLAR